MQSQGTSASLLSRIRDSSNHAAWQEFDERYRRLLLRFCCRQGVSRTDAEDVVQQVFASLARSVTQFIYDPNRGRFRDYLYRCVRNSIADWTRRPERRVQAVASQVGEALFLSGSHAESQQPMDPAWEEEWAAHHCRLALATIRQTFDPNNVALFEKMLGGARAADLAREHGLSEAALFKVRERIRDRMRELVAQQIREEDEL